MRSLLITASPNIVTRLPRSSNSVRTVTYLNAPTTEESEPGSLLEGKDHPVVAGYLPSYVRLIS